MSNISSDLLKKYDVPAPRYTSYPTVPYWQDPPTTEQWLESLNQALEPESASWSMYLHIPYCETLCSFCGCNTTITKNHDRGTPYVEDLLKEWQLYKENSPAIVERPLRNLHLGGGTPTFLSSEQLEALLKPILQDVKADKDNFEASIEVDPRRTSTEQLKTLHRLGFQRVSLGVQDFNLEVQKLMNRIQPYEMTRDLTIAAREIGYDSVNFDLIYGLPKQSEEFMRKTVEMTIELRPDRIALYSLAIVPWIKPAQRLFKDEDLPNPEEKRRLYEVSRQMLLDAGYEEIGMDHFALPSDELSEALKTGELHRNFMGYTSMRTDVLLGLGVSSISESPTCFHQNEKALPVYERRVRQEELPTLRGHLLNEEDRLYREQILQFMTRSAVELKDDTQVSDVQDFLKPLIEDELVSLQGKKLKITERGRPFLRNACMALDARMRVKKPDAKVFSQSI